MKCETLTDPDIDIIKNIPIVNLCNCDKLTLLPINNLITDITLIQKGSMVICRNSNPLIDLYFQLLGNGVKVYLKGDDILSSITRFLKPYSYKTVPEAKRKIVAELDRLKKIEKKP